MHQRFAVLIIFALIVLYLLRFQEAGNLRQDDKVKNKSTRITVEKIIPPNLSSFNASLGTKRSSFDAVSPGQPLYGPDAVAIQASNLFHVRPPVCGVDQMSNLTQWSLD